MAFSLIRLATGVNRVYLGDVAAHEQTDICLWVFVIIFDSDNEGVGCFRRERERAQERQIGVIKCHCLAAPDQRR